MNYKNIILSSILLGIAPFFRYKLNDHLSNEEINFCNYIIYILVLFYLLFSSYKKTNFSSSNYLNISFIISYNIIFLAGIYFLTLIGNYKELFCEKMLEILIILLVFILIYFKFL
jgi:uncharacterized membrane protein